MNKHCLIIGGGAAGLMSAVALLEQSNEADNLTITIIERMDNVGFKLLATGNGRCNLTNILEVEDFINRGFGTQKARFVRSAIYDFSPAMQREFFQFNGVDTVIIEDGFHVFPASQKSVDVLNVFKDKLINNPKVNIVTNAKLTKIKLNEEQNLVKSVIVDSKEIFFDYLIVSCGGMSYPQTGSNGSIFPILKNIGVNVVDCVPALVGLRVKDSAFTRLAGNVLENAEVKIEHKSCKKMQKDFGELLFTLTGVSGPAILDLSGKVNRLIHDGEKVVSLRVNLNADYDLAFWEDILQNNRKINGAKIVRSILRNYFFQNLVDLILEKSNIPTSKRVAELTAIQLSALLENLTNLKIEITGNDTFKKAIATSGGVDLKDVVSKELSHKNINNLFFAGETLDIDGRCGGYNLTWAFASGRLVAKSILEHE